MKREEIKEYRSTFSEQTINEIAELYDSGEKIANIIEKYQLEISPGQMTYFLPKISTEYICPYCKVPMLKRRNRNTGSWVTEKIACGICGHLYTDGFGKCYCENCKKRVIDAIQMDKQIIRTNYGALIPIKKLEFGELKFSQQCMLYILYYMEEIYSDLEVIPSSALQSRLKMELISQLKNDGILYVSPESDLYAFARENFPYVYDESLVDYFVNVHFSSEEKLLIANRMFSTNEDMPTDEIKELIHKFMYEDLLDNFEELLRDRNIDFAPTCKQLSEFYDLLNELSYTQLRFLCYKVAVFYSDGITTGKIYKGKAPKQVLASVSTFYHNIMKKFGSVYKSNIKYVGEQLRFLIESVLKKDIMILDDTISILANER